jgi:hypothetical protein
MTNQLSLVPEEPVEPVKQVKKRGPYKKRQPVAKPERAMAQLEMRTALLNGLFETTHKVYVNPNAKDYNPLANEKSAVLDKDNPVRLQLREFIVKHDYTDEKTNVVYPDAITLRIKAPALMGIKAETVLLSVLHLAGKNDLIKLAGLPWDPENADESNPEKALMLGAEGEAKKMRTPPVVTTMSELLRTAAMGHGSNDYKLLDAYLEQMSDIRVYYHNSITGWKGGSAFLTYSLHESGCLKVALNWRLTGAILKEYMYAKIDLNERHALSKDNCKTLHRWLSAHVWEGRATSLKYSTLASHVWTDVTTTLAQKKREQRIKAELLVEINKLDHWSIEFLKDRAVITRLKKSKDSQIAA